MIVVKENYYRLIFMIVFLLLGIILILPGQVLSAGELPAVYINEIMASNGDTILDEEGDSGDWIELYNPSSKPINIGGFYISDKVDDPFKWQIPQDEPEKTTIPAGGFILLWADKDIDKGPDHLDFKLSKDGEAVLLTSPDKETIIDKIKFGPQKRDVSYGRKPDGSEQLEFFLEPTPEAPNHSRGFSYLKTVDNYTFFRDNRILVISTIFLFIIILVLSGIVIRFNRRLKGDFSKKKKTEEELQEITGEYETILDNTQDAIFLVDVNPDNEFRYKRVNNSYMEYTGFSREEVINKTPREVYDRETGKGIEANYRRCANRKEIMAYDEELAFPAGKGVYHTQLSPVIIDNKVVQIVGSSRDITERKKMEEEIRDLSYHDKLTGLYNRAYFNEELRRYDTERQLPLSIIIGDVNGLKMTNDVFGHQKGDKLLIKIAQIIKDTCRQEDLVARWGGDEFVVVLPKTDEETVQRVCERINESCSGYLEIPIKISIALGYAIKREPTEDIYAIFKAAEEQMYKNKLKESKKYHNNIISIIRERLDKYTYETKEHNQRLTEMVLALGNRLDISDSRREDLKLLAISHDLGEVTLDSKILLKKEGLTAAEWEEIKKHPEKGNQIVSFSTELARIAEGILSHHERWDGTGYPQGLKGQEIPLISRVFAVVDAYEAMTVGRPYQTPLSKVEALEEIIRKSGSQFDPEIVEHFIKLNNDLAEQSGKSRLKHTGG